MDYKIQKDVPIPKPVRGKPIKYDLPLEEMVVGDFIGVDLPKKKIDKEIKIISCLLYTSPSPRDDL
mgnify:CR=1 FL=1